MQYDIIIIGGGPTGISCAIEAKRAGLNYIIIEKGVLVNSIYHFPTNMTFFSTAPKIEIGEIPFIAHQDKPTRAEALEYYRRLVFHYDINIHLNEQVNSVVKQEFTFITTTSKSKYESKNVIICTGYYDIPQLMNVPGENLQKVKHYYDDAHPYIKKNVVVVGAANSACDVALELWSKGANVTMVIRGDALYKGVKYWILPNIENRIKEGSIKAYFNSAISSISDNHVVINTPDVIVTIENDIVLAMTGYQIDYDLLSACGVTFYDDELQLPIINPDTFETELKGLYIAGVLVSGRDTSKLFIENTRHHGAAIIASIASGMGN
jgi:thioredoxin reductase (NADPH)